MLPKDGTKEIQWQEGVREGLVSLCVGDSPATICLAWCDSQVLATGGADGRIRVWDLSSPQWPALVYLANRYGWVTSIAFHNVEVSLWKDMSVQAPKLVFTTDAGLVGTINLRNERTKDCYSRQFSHWDVTCNRTSNEYFVASSEGYLIAVSDNDKEQSPRLPKCKVLMCLEIESKGTGSKLLLNPKLKLPSIHNNKRYDSFKDCLGDLIDGTASVGYEQMAKPSAQTQQGSMSVQKQSQAVPTEAIDQLDGASKPLKGRPTNQEQSHSSTMSTDQPATQPSQTLATSNTGPHVSGQSGKAVVVPGGGMVSRKRKGKGGASISSTQKGAEVDENDPSNTEEQKPIPSSSTSVAESETAMEKRSRTGSQLASLVPATIRTQQEVESMQPSGSRQKGKELLRFPLVQAGLHRTRILQCSSTRLLAVAGRAGFIVCSTIA
mmetsp:Transcript_2959/g.4808  ORF Transcript_2959/g.4808 Transcript_2959/m.4808 type:complete len:437 (-) Transcript_2959:100-1410(-)